MSTPRRLPIWTFASVFVALTGNVVAAAFLVVPLFGLPPGSSVRLLVESYHSALATLGTLVAVAVLSIIAWRQECHRFASVVALCLALLSFPFSGWAMRHTAAERRIFLKP